MSMKTSLHIIVPFWSVMSLGIRNEVTDTAIFNFALCAFNFFLSMLYVPLVRDIVRKRINPHNLFRVVRFGCAVGDDGGDHSDSF